MPPIKIPSITLPPLTNAIKAVQIVAGLVIVYIIYVLAVSAMKSDKLVIDEQYDMALKRMVVITDGYIESTLLDNKINTSVPFADTYLPIIPSINIKGGSQFTYSFWVNVGDIAEAKGKTLFVKGDKEFRNYYLTEKKYDVNSQSMVDKHSQIINGRVAMCPAVSFGNSATEVGFVVKFNTLHNMNETLEVKSMKAANNIYRNNLLSLVSGQWFMITIVFQDNVPVGDFENGLSVKFYVNDVLYQQGQYSSALKQNHGDFIMFPDTSFKGTRMSGLTYYNYALGDADIRNLAGKGAVTTPSTLAGKVNASALYLSDMNRMDMYNA